MARLSGLQRDVLALYRRCLRLAISKDKDSSSSHSSFLQSLYQSGTSTHYCAHEFRRKTATVARSDFKRIEYMLRQGDKQLKLMSRPGVKVVGGTSV